MRDNTVKGIRKKECCVRKFYHYIINASDAKERQVFMKKQFEKWGGANFFEAIMGQDVSPENWKKWVVPDDICSLRKGEVGCALSHINCYKKLLASDEPYLFLFEDDIKISDRFFKSIDDICEYMDVQTEPVVILFFDIFDTRVHKIGTIGRDIGVYRALGGCGTFGYVINRKAAANLIRMNLPIFTQADAWRTFIKAGLVDLRCLDKKMVCEDGYFSERSIIDHIESREENDKARIIANEKRAKALKYMYNKMTFSERWRALKSRVLLHIRELYYDKI